MTYKFFAKVLSYEDDQDSYYLDTVCGFASNYAEAAGKIEDYFKSSLIEVRSLELLEATTSEIFLIPEEMREVYRNEDELAYSTKCTEEGELING